MSDATLAARFLTVLLGAAVSVGLLFSLVDPLGVDAVHLRLGGSREAACTLIFVYSSCSGACTPRPVR